MPLDLRTNFRPSAHGFRFANEFRNQAGLLSFYGRCNGMSWIALDYFNAGRPVPRTVNVDFERPLVAGLAAALTPEGVVQVFGPRTREDNAANIVGIAARGAVVGRWTACAAGGTPIAPAAACWGPGRTDLLAVGDDRKLYLCSHEGGVLAEVARDCSGGLPGFSELGGTTDRQPAMASPYAQRLEVYAVGIEDRNLHFRFFEGGRWSGWSSLGRPGGRAITSGCAAAAHHGFMGGYVRGEDNALWGREWVGGGWQDWRSFGGVFTSGPAAVAPYPGRLELYGRGTDGAVWTGTREGSSWSGWGSLGAPPGGTMTEAPAAVGRRGHQDVFVRSADNRVWRRTFQNGAWSAWAMADLVPPPEAKRLADAIFGKTMTSTVSPLIAATGPLGVGLPFLGPARNYVTWRSPSTEQTFRWTATDELRKLIGVLARGTPVPLGLIAYDGWGHEVVACGLTSDTTLPVASPDFPGRFAYRIRVYDPNHPGCDDVHIEFHGRDLDRQPINRDAPAIRSTTGEAWRGCFVRDDYRPDVPPL